MGRRLAIVCVACLVVAAPAAGDSGGKLGQVQARIAAARAKEARLAKQINEVTSSIRTLESRVGDVSRKLSVLEQDLQLHERRLDKLDALFAFETERLTFLRRAPAQTLHELSFRMIDIYETHDPTPVAGIIQSDPLPDALHPLPHPHPIAPQDQQNAA